MSEHENGGELTVIKNGGREVDVPRSLQEITGQVQLIQQVMKGVMKDGEHYGKVPGCGEKPALLKAGAEKLSFTFKLTPKFKIDVCNLPGGHKEYQIVCSIHSMSGMFMGEGVGAGSTMEGKYRFRNAGRKCPVCGKETIVKGKSEYGGGWLCFVKKGGCGAKFADGSKEIEAQEVGRVEHDNPADFYNTVLKMAKKRAHVDAILTVTAASDIFTQDIDDTMQPENQSQPMDVTPPMENEKPPLVNKQLSAPVVMIVRVDGEEPVVDGGTYHGKTLASMDKDDLRKLWHELRKEDQPLCAAEAKLRTNTQEVKA